MSNKTKPHKSWQEKLAYDKDLPQVVKLTGKLAKRWLAGRSLGEGRGTGTMAIPTPQEIDEIMRKVPKGRLITINQIREILARKYHATIGCPITTGIFAWIAAHAAEEAAAEGKKNTTCWWRTLKSQGEINEKYPGGGRIQEAYLKQEGFTIEPGKGKKPPKVKDFEKYLVNL